MSRDRTHPYETFLVDALGVVVDRGRPRSSREACSRLVYFLLGWVPETERLVADLLEAATKTTDAAETCRVLVLGVWRVVQGDHRLVSWIKKIANRALTEGYLETFAALLETLVCVDAYDGIYSPDWIEGVRRAREVPAARPHLFWLIMGYGRRFAPVDSIDAPTWVIETWSDPRLRAAVREVPSSGERGGCPACGELQSI